MSIAQQPNEVLERVEDLYLAGKLSLTAYLVLARACHTAMDQHDELLRHEPLPVRIIPSSDQP